MIRSKSLIGSVVDDMALAKDDRLAKAQGVSLVGGDLSPAQKADARREQAIELLQRNVTMLAPTDSRIATISFKSRNPAFSAQIANALAEHFVQLNVNERYQTNSYARKVLTDQVNETRQKLGETETKAIAYARANDLIDTADASTGADHGTGGGGESGGARSLVTASLSAVNSALNSAKTARIAVEERWRQAAASNALDTPEGRENATIQSFVQQRAQVAAKLAQLHKRYVLSQPDVQEAQAELSTIDSQLASAEQSLKRSIQSEYATAVREEKQLETAKEKLSEETLLEQQKRVSLNLIGRDADILREQLAQLLTRLNLVSAAADVTTNNIAIVDRAETPDAPISPSLLRNLLIGIAAGIALGIALALLREMLDDTIHAPSDVEIKLQIPLLGLTPWVGNKLDEEFAKPQSGLREAYHSIRTAVDFSSGGAVSKVLLITSSAPDEGKTTTALALAQDFARLGRKVLLVDADTRRPNLHLSFGRENSAAGLTDVLMKTQRFEDVIVQNEGEPLFFLAMGTRHPNPVNLISSEEVTHFFAKLREEFDLVIVDCAPVMGLADAPILSRVADGVIFVVEAARAHNGQVKAAIRRMRSHGATIFGAILSKFDPRSSGLGKESGYYSYYEYEYSERKPRGEKEA